MKYHLDRISIVSGGSECFKTRFRLEVKRYSSNLRDLFSIKLKITPVNFRLGRRDIKY